MRARALQALTFVLCLLGVGCGSNRSSSPSLVSPLAGSNVGQKMPPFTARDQFGHDVSSDSLQSPNGTVLLFFRSADW